MTAESWEAGPPLGGPLGRLAARAYGRVVARRNARFDAGVGVHRLPVGIISVGNLSVGGTGKTPTVERICRWLCDQDHRPAIAMRGYRAAGGLSDEAEAYRASLDGVPVVAQPDRLGGLHELFARDSGRDVDTVVLDDGFQHRRIARDLDIVLLDLSRGSLDDRLLPAGWLREPVASLARAHAVVLTHAELTTPEQIAAVRQRVRRHAPDALLAAARHGWVALDVFEDGRERTEPPSWIAGRFPLAVCAIGNPGAFLGALRAAVGEVEPREGRSLAAAVLRDHHPYRERTIRQILAFATRQRPDVIVTTAKDWSKLRSVHPERWPCPVVRPRLEIAFDFGEEALRRRVLDVAGPAGRSTLGAAAAVAE